MVFLSFLHVLWVFLRDRDIKFLFHLKESCAVMVLDGAIIYCNHLAMVCDGHTTCEHMFLEVYSVTWTAWVKEVAVCPTRLVCNEHWKGMWCIGQCKSSLEVWCISLESWSVILCWTRWWQWGKNKPSASLFLLSDLVMEVDIASFGVFYYSIFLVALKSPVQWGHMGKTLNFCFSLAKYRTPDSWIMIELQMHAEN